jgi:hypothetical protein
MGHGFRNTDEGSEVKDVGCAGAGFGEGGGVEDGALKEGALDARQVSLFPGREVIEDGDRPPGRQPPSQVASDEAGTPCDEEFHFSIFPKERALESAGKNGLRKIRCSGITKLCERSFGSLA